MMDARKCETPTPRRKKMSKWKAPEINYRRGERTATAVWAMLGNS